MLATAPNPHDLIKQAAVAIKTASPYKAVQGTLHYHGDKPARDTRLAVSTGGKLLTMMRRSRRHGYYVSPTDLASITLRIERPANMDPAPGLIFDPPARRSGFPTISAG